MKINASILLLTIKIRLISMCNIPISHKGLKLSINQENQNCLMYKIAMYKIVQSKEDRSRGERIEMK